MIKKTTKIADEFSRQFENQPIMTSSNVALRCHEDIDHWVFYHLKDVCHMCRRSLNHLPLINAVPCDIAVDVNVNFDTRIARKRQMFWLSFLWQNVRVVYCFITKDYLIPSLAFNVTRSFGNLNWNLALVTSNFGLGLRQFDGTAAQNLRFNQNMIL